MKPHRPTQQALTSHNTSSNRDVQVYPPQNSDSAMFLPLCLTDPSMTRCVSHPGHFWFSSQALSLELVMIRVDFLIGSPMSGAHSPKAHMSGLASQYLSDTFMTGTCFHAAERKGSRPRTACRGHSDVAHTIPRSPRIEYASDVVERSCPGDRGPCCWGSASVTMVNMAMRKR